MEHIEECKSLDEWEVFDDTDGHKSIRQKCICDVLRACEQRVHEAAYQSGKAYGLTVNGYTRGYAEALNRARDAVAALDAFDVRPIAEMEYQPAVYRDNALAAIDALRVEET